MVKRAITNLRNDFPILQKKINNCRLDYLDNAATTQLAQPISDKIIDFYHTSYANVHRGVASLNFAATASYEKAREKVKKFLNARSNKEVIFTSGTTDSINLAAISLRKIVQPGDEIVVTIMEHHSNLLPWQYLAQTCHLTLKFITLTKEGTLNLKDAQKKITARTKIVAVCHVSNVLGVINPIKELTQLAHKNKAVILVDGAQAVGHFSIDVQDLDVDFYAFSGHKMLAPTGIGVLYGKEKWLNYLEPVRLGGEMISRVTKKKATWANLPQKFEAGTPNIAGAIGLGAAIDYLNSIGLAEISDHEQKMVSYVLPKLLKIPKIKVYGPQKNHIGVIAFNLKNVHSHDVATALDQQGVEVRAGQHCAEPLMTELGLTGSVRISLQIYNNQEDLDQFLTALAKTWEFFNGFK